MLINGPNLTLIAEMKTKLQLKFKMKDLGELKYFLGIEFARSQRGILMHQRKYTLELIFELGLGAAKPTATPIEANIKLTTKKYDEHTSSSSATDDEVLADIIQYQRLLGKLLYLTVTRPDIAYSIQTLSQSSAESEYKSVASTVAELVWILGLFKDIGIKVDLPVNIYIGSKSAIQIAANPVFHERTKHIEIGHHFIREKIQNGLDTAIAKTEGHDHKEVEALRKEVEELKEERKEDRINFNKLQSLVEKFMRRRPFDPLNGEDGGDNEF
uniref:Reverse transcriptase Ty1/copia-type domain-containing protein n=1 Tax=Nicotiana tabacum TaxID=4097 RepID=A0A1S3YL01_TOBAC|nr:PREDICTED: uncharacterized protein LOC107777412 [Nicotiana tabacum]